MKHSSIWFASILKKLGLRAEHPISENPKAENEGHPANDNAGESTPIARTIEDVRDTIIREYQRSQKEQSAENRKNRTIACAAVLGAYLYAGIAAFQWCTMRTNNELIAR